MKTAVQWGAINTAAYVVLSLGLYVLGFQTEKIATGQYFQWLGFLAFILITVLGLKEASSQAGDKGFSYGDGIKFSALMGLACGLFSAIYCYIHFSFINTEFVDYYLGFIRGQWKDAGLNSEQIEAAEKVTRAMSSPGAQAVITLIVGVGFSLVIGLVAAAFVKRPALADTPNV